MSTAKATQKAAQDLSKGREAEATRLPLESGAVTEFHAADVTGGSPATTQDTKSKSAKVHGKAYGSTSAAGSGAQRAGGAVGATSKGGKTSVYVEADRARASTGSPQ